MTGKSGLHVTGWAEWDAASVDAHGMGSWPATLVVVQAVVRRGWCGDGPNARPQLFLRRSFGRETGYNYSTYSAYTAYRCRPSTVCLPLADPERLSPLPSYVFELLLPGFHIVGLPATTIFEREEALQKVCSSPDCIVS